jgi:protein O-GlcNAc transferase
MLAEASEQESTAQLQRRQERQNRLARAKVLAEQGRWDLAAPLFRAVVMDAEDVVDALRGLGRAALHANHPAEAVTWFTRARYFAPYDVPLLSELGLAQKRAGLLPQALATYRRGLSLHAEDPALLVNLGRAEREAGSKRGAILAFRRALALSPQAPEVWSMLSNVLREAGQAAEALEAAQKALTYDPWLREAHLNEGAAQHGRGALAEASVSYLIAAQDPRLRPAALANLRLALASLGERAAAISAVQQVLRVLKNSEDERAFLQLARAERGVRPHVALCCYERALAITPTAEPARELARLLWELGRVEAALERLLRTIASDRDDVHGYRLLGEWLSVPNKISLHSSAWQRVFAECPKDAPALRNLGVALRRRGFPVQAAKMHRRALELEPRSASSLVNLGAALSSQGAGSDAIAAYRRALAVDPNHWDAASNLLFDLHLDASQTPQDIFTEHVRFGQSLSESVQRQAGVHACAPLQGRRLRVGYVSPDFRSHPVAHFFEPVLRAHDRNALEVFCYSDVEHPDAVTARLAGFAEHFIPCAGAPHGELSARIAADGIDILVDLAGHTGRNRLPVFARKPSPIQASWLGYFDTTGITAVDYRIADAPSLPAAAERYFVERIVRLPRSANCFLPPPGPEPSGPPCATSGHITFGCFNNPAKIGRGVVATFARVLQAVPNSEILLKYLAFNDPEVCARYRGWFQEEGIAGERVHFEGPSSLERFQASFSRIDIALDPFPYSGETTALHTLWMGVPLVTLEGPTLVQRLASRVLRIAGLNEWVAANEDEYLKIAGELARDTARLSQLRQSLRPSLRASPLLDHRGVTRDLEAAYHELWRAGCAREQTPTAKAP